MSIQLFSKLNRDGNHVRPTPLSAQNVTGESQHIAAGADLPQVEVQPVIETGEGCIRGTVVIDVLRKVVVCSGPIVVPINGGEQTVLNGGRFHSDHGRVRGQQS